MSQLLNPPYVIGMPTETVYGLAARIDCPQGIEAIFKIKERPFFDPLIVHVSSIDQAKSLVSEWPLAAQILAEKFWPGPLTLVLPKADNLNSMITSGLQTVGLRMPRHPLALELIAKEGPLAAPSANKFGKTSPTSADHVRQEFANQVPVLDGGPCEVGIESTVLSVSKDVVSILRPGAVTKGQIEASLPAGTIFADPVDKKSSPGQMKHHYMPNVPLLISDRQNLDLEDIEIKIQKMPKEIEGVKIVKPHQGIRNVKELVLSENPQIASRQLYSELRNLAGEKPDLIVFYRKKIHQTDPWSAIMDRLTKASTLEIK